MPVSQLPMQPNIYKSPSQFHTLNNNKQYYSPNNRLRFTKTP
jgi:hypothetical protein